MELFQKRGARMSSDTEWPGVEKRKNPRVDCREKATLTMGKHSKQSVVINVSPDGVFIITDEEFRPGQVVRVSYYSPLRKHHLDVTGTVVRKSRRGIGVMF